MDLKLNSRREARELRRRGEEQLLQGVELKEEYQRAGHFLEVLPKLDQRVDQKVDHLQGQEDQGDHRDNQDRVL